MKTKIKLTETQKQALLFAPGIGNPNYRSVSWSEPEQCKSTHMKYNRCQLDADHRGMHQSGVVTWNQRPLRRR